MLKIKSPYTASFTGGGFLRDEMREMLPLLMHPDSEALVKDEIVNNRILHINTERSRKRVMCEIRRRYAALPRSFWTEYLEMDDLNQRVATFYAIMKTYKLIFDLHVNVALRRWRSVSRTVEQSDVQMELSEIASSDAYVDSWSDLTRKKISSTYILMIHKARLLDRDHNLTVPECTNFDYYLRIGEPWFLEACLLEPYQIAEIQKQAR